MINAAIGGNVNLDANVGDIQVTLNDGAQVGGVIDANTSSNSTLSFKFSTTSAADYAAALATLVPANASGGTLTINGQSYTWTNFDNLVNLIELIVAQNPVRTCEGNARLNLGDCNAPVAIHQTSQGLVTLRHGADKTFLYSMDAESLQPGSEPILLFATFVQFKGEDVYVELYLLPDGNLQVLAGDYAFAWNPASE